MSLRPLVALPGVISGHRRYCGEENIVLKIFKEHAELNGEKVTLHEAAVLMAQALAPMWRAYTKPDGYEHYDMAMAVKYNVINVEVDGMDFDED